MARLLSELNERKKLLKSTVTKGESVDLLKLIATEPNDLNSEAIRNYFFQAAVDEWYNKLESYTFRSEFLKLDGKEISEIISYWNQVTSKSDDIIVEIPTNLFDLVQKIDWIISNKFSHSKGVFVKLSTRSPKDSKTLLRKATASFEMKMNSCDEVLGTEDSINSRLVAFSEEMAKAAMVYNGTEAVTYLLDSWRVAEDLLYACEEGKKDADISLVIREWDERISPKCEYRGFVWDFKLNAVGQYWHSLYFHDLEDTKNVVAEDFLRFFEEIKSGLPIPNAMLDLAWIGPGEVMLIEVNPLMEGLGSFKGSTGLFDFYEDEKILTGQAPFEIRVRESAEERAKLLNHMSMAWRKVVFGL